MLNWHYYIYFLLLKMKLEAERPTSASSVLTKAKVVLLSLYLVIQIIHFNTKLEEKLPAYLGGQESLTHLCLLHIIHRFTFLSISMEPVRNSHCYTLPVYPHSFKGGSEQEMKDFKTLLFLIGKPWQHWMAVPHGTTKADIKRNPLFQISDQNISYFCF